MKNLTPEIIERRREQRKKARKEFNRRLRGKNAILEGMATVIINTICEEIGLEKEKNVSPGWWTDRSVTEVSVAVLFKYDIVITMRLSIKKVLESQNWVRELFMAIKNLESRSVVNASDVHRLMETQMGLVWGSQWLMSGYGWCDAEYVQANFERTFSSYGVKVLEIQCPNDGSFLLSLNKEFGVVQVFPQDLQFHKHAFTSEAYHRIEEVLKN